MQFDELIRKRRSIRAYQAGVTLAAEDIRALAEAVRQAPSWKNTQTGRVYFAASAEAVEKVRACLPGFNQKSTDNAAGYMVTAYVPDVSGFTAGKPDNELGNQWGSYDLGLQNAYLILKAADLGYDTLIMGLRDVAGLHAALSIPENEVIVSVIAIGRREGEPVLRPRRDGAVLVKVL